MQILTFVSAQHRASPRDEGYTPLCMAHVLKRLFENMCSRSHERVTWEEKNYFIVFWVAFLPNYHPFPYYEENSLENLPSRLSFPLQSKIRIGNILSFPNDNKVEWWLGRGLSGLAETQLVYSVSVPCHQAVRRLRLEDQLYPFTSCWLGTNDIVPLNFTLLNCKMGILPRRVRRPFCKMTPGNMFHKMFSM